jgi:predicted  nucleic acid-binding Zn-ribbon protein
MTPEQQIEIRLAALEEARTIFNNFNAHQMLQNRETNENLAILLRVAREQERDIKAMRADISSLKSDVATMQVDIAAINNRLEGVEGRLSRVETRLESIEAQLGIEFGAVNQQLADIRVLLTGGIQPKPPEP